MSMGTPDTAHATCTACCKPRCPVHVTWAFSPHSDTCIHVPPHLVDNVGQPEGQSENGAGFGTRDAGPPGAFVCCTGVADMCL